MTSKVLAFAVVVVATFAICVGLDDTLQGGSKNQKGKAKAPPAKQPPPKPAVKPASSPVKLDPGPQMDDPPADAPKLGLSLNGLKHAVVRAGSQVFIESTVKAGDAEEGVASIELSKPGEAWSDLVDLQIRDSKNDLVPGPALRSLIKGKPSIRLDEKQSGKLAWELDLAAKALTPGEYRIQAVLNCPPLAGSEWKGKVKSHVSRLTVKPANSELNLDDLRAAAVAKVQILAYAGKDADAVRVCEEFLAKHPEDIVLFEGKGDALFRQKKFQEAHLCYEKAISFVKPNDAPHRITEPPHMLIRKSKRALLEHRKSSKT